MTIRERLINSINATINSCQTLGAEEIADGIIENVLNENREQRPIEEVLKKHGLGFWYESDNFSHLKIKVTAAIEEITERLQKENEKLKAQLKREEISNEKLDPRYFRLKNGQGSKN